ncbi:DUF1330 domain-containing protein [Rhodococcus sp. NPDC058521]|uniref:DUF1330 domain-containing protein n=1 Tax=Rhodococcus sp. NPDC058521 TaxID=3346536 RepID=UPI003665CA4D
MSVPTYAIAHLRTVDLGDGIVEYLERIDGTLAPFGGRFIVHGATPDVREGAWTGDLIVIEFPSAAKAVGWYDSPEYREIIPPRTDNSDGSVFLVEGVEQPHRATDILA